MKREDWVEGRIGGGGVLLVLSVAALIELAGTARSVVRQGFGVAGIELRGLVEDSLAGGLIPSLAAEIEVGLGWRPCGMDDGRQGGLTEVGENPAYWLGIGLALQRAPAERPRSGKRLPVRA